VVAAGAAGAFATVSRSVAHPTAAAAGTRLGDF